MSDDLESLQLREIQEAYAEFQVAQEACNESLRSPERFGREWHWLLTNGRGRLCRGYALCERCGAVLQPGSEMVVMDGRWCCARCYREKSQ